MTRTHGVHFLRGVHFENLHDFQEFGIVEAGPHGRINANDYLVVAERYREAADNYRYLDETLDAMGMETTLDNIQLYYLPKYQSNAKAGRRDSAIVIGAHILSLLDSTITSHKNSAMAELATIYDTQGKEAEIARKEADLEHTRLVSTGIAHKATVTEDFQIMKDVVLNKRREDRIHQWVVDKIKSTYTRLNDDYKDCKFEYEGWIK